ncbi:rod shape-determining protein MreD [Bacillus niameyensis]|uniref:rod shape-determining protein MreD n=1 Tax=Bacillus niameyensis TaxID=1522308 RepID=UPI0007816DF5|nr:rod shape-determining protein MreD [Bacillus niameyensis]
MKRLILPLLLLIGFYLEGIFVELVRNGSFGLNVILVPRFLTVLFAVMGIYYVRNYSLIYAAVFGLLFDVYYTEIIGIYLFLFPIIVYIASKITKLLQANILTTFFVVLLSVALVEFVVYGFNVFVLQKEMELEEFAKSRLWSTLGLNQLFLLLIYYPFKKLLFYRKKDELHE